MPILCFPIQANTGHPYILEIDLKVINLSTVLTCFSIQTMKHSVTIDKQSLSSFSQTSTF